MTFKRSFALAALLAIALSSTTGLARRNPEEPLTHSAVLSQSAWTVAKFVALQQYISRVSPELEARLKSIDSTNGTSAKLLADAIVAGLFLNSFKEYAENLGGYLWDSVGAPLANQLPEPLRSIVCND